LIISFADFALCELNTIELVSYKKYRSSAARTNGRGETSPAPAYRVASSAR